MAAVLLVHRGFAFDGLISNQQPDVLSYFLPTHCLLGRTLASGHIPAWTPAVMAGAPFAADPQSGWMYLPAMGLYSLLPCGAALRWFIVLQPMLAGLGIHAFLRVEGLSRAAAAVGGLAAALPLAGSQLTLALPFAGALAWTSVLLATAAKVLRAPGWPRRLLWVGGAALAWGQLAAAHLSHGLLLGSGALLAYGAATVFGKARVKRGAGRDAALAFSALLVALPILNLAYLAPRLAHLPRTSIAKGYGGLQALSEQLTGSPANVLGRFGATAFPWALRLVHAPGLYLGAGVLVLCLAGWRAAGRRPLFAAFFAYGAVFYLIALEPVARGIASATGSSIVGQPFAHESLRFRYALLIAIPVLAALGVEAWRETRSLSGRVLLLLPGVGVWGILPVATGVEESYPVFFAVGLAAAAGALACSAWRPALIASLPLLVAVELSASGLLGQSRPLDRGNFPQLLAPSLDPDDVLGTGVIARTLRSSPGARYVSLDPSGWEPIGYHVRQAPADRPLLAMQQSLLVGLEAAQGYNPSQPLRYWSFVRRSEPRVLRYNVSYFTTPSTQTLNLLQVGWVVARAGGPPPVAGLESVQTEGKWTLYRIQNAAPRASVLGSWEVAPSSLRALETVAAEGFDPERTVVLEEDPGLSVGATGSAGSAVYRQLGPQAAHIRVDASRPALVLIRNSYYPNWRAELDGRPVRLLVANSLMQAVAVPAGRHTIELRYDDPWIGYGLAGSAIGFSILFGGAFVLSRRPVWTATGTARRADPYGRTKRPGRHALEGEGRSPRPRPPPVPTGG
ncbi:hypothetical protein BH20ACT24_BH20ACT24_04620 [soil metagenome]